MIIMKGLYLRDFRLCVNHLFAGIMAGKGSYQVPCSESLTEGRQLSTSRRYVCVYKVR